jgi:hypothetical protein
LASRNMKITTVEGVVLYMPIVIDGGPFAPV